MRSWTLLLGVLAVLGAVAALPSGASASDYDCADFVSQAEAEEYLLPGDPYRLDADHDGIACEDLPCPCSSSPGGGAEEETPSEHKPPPPPPQLEKAAAREAAKRKARHYNRLSARIETIAFNGCRRRSREKVVCLFTGHGHSPAALTTCHLRIPVRGQGAEASAGAQKAHCHTERQSQVLSYGRARAALQADANRIAGKEVALTGIERLGPTSFSAQSEWHQLAANGAAQQCFLELSAELRSSGAIRVRVLGRECETS